MENQKQFCKDNEFSQILEKVNFLETKDMLCLEICLFRGISTSYETSGSNLI